VPSRYAVCFQGQPQPLEADRILSQLPAPAERLLRARSRTRFEVGTSNPAFCSEVATEDARALAEAISGLEKDDGGLYRLGYRLDASGQLRRTALIWFEPYLPHGEFLLFSAGR
jgi:hypothetical protein